MRRSDTQKTIKNWLRMAAKLSLILTEPKVRQVISDQFKGRVNDISDDMSDRYDDLSDRVSSKYEDAADRVGAAADALQGKSHWVGHLGGFLLGVGVGAGIGILLAPAEGSETRDAIRDKAVDIKDRIFDSAAAESDRVRQSVGRMPTGTEL